MTYRLQSKRITYALRRLHTNPSDWIKIKHFRRSALFFGAYCRARTYDPFLVDTDEFSVAQKRRENSGIGRARTSAFPRTASADARAS